MVILISLLTRLFLISILFSKYFSFPSYISSLRFKIVSELRSMVVNSAGQWLLLVLFLFLLIVNVRGNIPLNRIPTLFYSQTLSLSLIFWVPLMICVSFSQLKEFLAHILPYGSPSGLMLILPVIEIFSQLIRPFTLIIRLRTNLSSGHIMIYMFSYFTLLSDILSPFINIVIGILFILELCISMLQAYIFRSLLVLYINETTVN